MRSDVVSFAAMMWEVLRARLCESNIKHTVVAPYASVALDQVETNRHESSIMFCILPHLARNAILSWILNYDLATFSLTAVAISNGLLTYSRVLIDNWILNSNYIRKR